MSSTIEYKDNQNLELSLDDNISDEKESFSPKVIHLRELLKK